MRSALQVLNSLGRGSQMSMLEGGRGSRRNSRLTCGSIIESPNNEPMTLSVNHQMSNLTRSSPSVFVTHTEQRPQSLIPLPPASPSYSTSSSRNKSHTRHVSTQTDLPINVPVEVLEAFVLAHRDRVLQLLGIKEEPIKIQTENDVVSPDCKCTTVSSPIVTYPVTSLVQSMPLPFSTLDITFTTQTTVASLCSKSEDRNEADVLSSYESFHKEPCTYPYVTLPEETPEDSSVKLDSSLESIPNNQTCKTVMIDQSKPCSPTDTVDTYDEDSSNVKRIPSIQYSTESSDDSVHSDNTKNEPKSNKTPLLQGSYQLENICNWNPLPADKLFKKNKVTLVSSVSTGGIKDILKNSHSYNSYDYSTRPHNFENIEENFTANRKFSNHYGCSADFNPSDLLCFTDDSKRPTNLYPNISRSTSMPTTGYHFKTKLRCRSPTLVSGVEESDSPDILVPISPVDDIPQSNQQTYATEC